MQDRSWRRRWAILATMLIVPVVLAAVFAASFEKPRSAEPFACPEPLTGIDAELKVHLEKKGLVAPQATVSMLVEVPNDNGIAWDLLRRVREDEHHKLALRCVLGEPVFYWNQAA